MKKAILFSALIFLSSAIFAQFTIGPKIGFTMSKLSTNIEDVTEDMKTGFQFGAFARFGKKLYVQPEVLFQEPEIRFNKCERTFASFLC